MERKTPFVKNEVYHLFTRGVEKREVFTCNDEYERFQLLLLLSNLSQRVHMSNFRAKYKGEPLIRLFEYIEPEHAHVDILAYALMPNHVHLIVKAKKDSGISTFMLRLMTAYSMYFNVRHKRSGPLFTRPFRSRHVDDDAYARWLFSYVHLNPLSIGSAESGKSETNRKSAEDFLRYYRYSSFFDYFLGDRPESRILNTSALPVSIAEFRTIDAIFDTYLASPEYQGEPLIHKVGINL